MYSVNWCIGYGAYRKGKAASMKLAAFVVVNSGKYHRNKLYFFSEVC